LKARNWGFTAGMTETRQGEHLKIGFLCSDWL